jgi:2-dehydro-3-deoxyglucarate aldolase/4-hydroxy-2-oxoheptanedioate aldolase
MSGTAVVPFVRAPWNDPVVIKRILDAGVYGVLVPYINSRAEAEVAVRACKYPPEGVRGIAGSPRAAGFGQNSKEYLTKANSLIMVIIAIETMEAVSNLDEILKIPNLDGVFIGPMDLATSMGYFADPSHPAVLATIAEIEKKVLGSKKILGTIANDWDQAKNLYQKGYQMLMIMADGVALGKLASEKVALFRKEFPHG